MRIIVPIHTPENIERTLYFVSQQAMVCCQSRRSPADGSLVLDRFEGDVARFTFELLNYLNDYGTCQLILEK